MPSCAKHTEGSTLSATGLRTAGNRHDAPIDAAILRSLPGVGRVVLATLLSEAAEPLVRRDHNALRNLCGVALATRRGGKRLVVTMRRAAHVRLRLALCHWSRVAIQRDPASRSRYSELRGRGHSPARALRSVADRLLSVACAMLKTGTLFLPLALPAGGRNRRLTTHGQ